MNEKKFVDQHTTDTLCTENQQDQTLHWVTGALKKSKLHVKLNIHLKYDQNPENFTIDLMDGLAIFEPS